MQSVIIYHVFFHFQVKIQLPCSMEVVHRGVMDCLFGSGLLLDLRCLFKGDVAPRHFKEGKSGIVMYLFISIVHVESLIKFTTLSA